MKKLLSSTFFILFAIFAIQSSPVTKNTIQITGETIENSDLLLQRDSIGLIVDNRYYKQLPENVSFLDTMFFEPAFLPLIFDGRILPDSLDFLRKESEQFYRYHLIDQDKTFAPSLKRQQIIHNLRKTLYKENPSLVILNAFNFTGEKPEEMNKVEKKNIFQELITVDKTSNITAPTEFEKYIPEKVYWIRNGEHSIQIAQNYVSKNWHQEGYSSYYIRNNHKLSLNYKKDKISFDNLLEWKLSLQQTPADSVHTIGITEDLVRMVNTFGITAFKRWSYTARLETKTQIFNSYPLNSNVKNTAFLSPIYLDLSLGMDYKLENTSKKNKYRKFKLSQNIAPLSLNYVYVKDESIRDIKRFGIQEGDRSALKVGSQINTDFTMNFNQYTSWTSRLKYWTDYHQSVMEFENKFDMALNRYFSTIVYFHIRFDDNSKITQDPDWGYFQRKELISFGLNYKWQ